MSEHRTSQGESFPSTHWSMIARAGGDGTGANDALGAFLTRYLPALRAHLLQARRIASQEADDLVQAFCLEKVVRGKLIQYADQSRGRFRNYLLRVLDNFVVTHHRRQTTRRGAPDQPLATLDETRVAATEPDPDAFDKAWARQVIDEALRRVEEQCQRDGRRDVWGVFVHRVLDPLLSDKPTAPYEDLIAKLGFATPARASNALVTAKRMLARALRDVVSEYARDEREIEEELTDLHAVLAGRRPTSRGW